MNPISQAGLVGSVESETSARDSGVTHSSMFVVGSSEGVGSRKKCVAVNIRVQKHFFAPLYLMTLAARHSGEAIGKEIATNAA